MAHILNRIIYLNQIDVVQLEYTVFGQYAGDYQHVVWIAPDLQSHGLRGASAAYMAALKTGCARFPRCGASLSLPCRHSAVMGRHISIASIPII